MLCHRKSGEFSFVYLIAFAASLSLGLSKAYTVSGASTVVHGVAGADAATAAFVETSRGGSMNSINSPPAATFSRSHSKIIEIPGNGTKSVPPSALWKTMGSNGKMGASSSTPIGRQGGSAAAPGQEIENLRARRNVMDKNSGGGKKFGGAHQSEDDILRLLSMIGSKDGINFFPGSNSRTAGGKQSGGFSPLNSFSRHGPGGFDFPDSSDILGSQNNYEDVSDDQEDDDDAIELGSFGGKIPPSFHEDGVSQRNNPSTKLYGGHQNPSRDGWSSETSSRRKPGNLRGAGGGGAGGGATGYDFDRNRSGSLEKDWLDSPLPLYSHQQMKRMMKLSGGHHHHRYILMKRKREAGPHQLTQLLTGPQQLTEPNIPIFHRFVL